MSLVTAAVASMPLPAAAQGTSGDKEEPEFIWPVAGQEAGDSILFKPQQYLDGRLNFADLYIAAPYGTPVLAPADGVFYRPCVSVRWQEQGMKSFGTDEDKTWNEQIASVVEGGNYDVPDNYVSMTVGIKLSDGRKVYISGLNGDMVIRDGEKISKGDTLGYVAYWEPAIDRPHIEVSVSNKDTTPGDSMTPFGLETTFVPAGAVVIPDSLTVEQAREDFRALMDVLEAEYPPLYDVISPQELAEYDSLTVYRDLASPVSYKDFYLLVQRTTSVIHDSHLLVMTPYDFSSDNLMVPNLLPGKIGDSLIVTRVQAGKGLEKYVGRRIVSIDGRPAQDIIDYVRRYMVGRYDGLNESYPDLRMSEVWNYFYGYEAYYEGKRESVLEFSDGEVYRDEWVPPRRAASVYPMPNIDMARYSHLFRYRDLPYSFEMLNDSTLYFGLSSFQLTKVQRDALRDSIAGYVDVPYMIMDLRDNPGGDAYFLSEMLTWFINRPTVPLGGYSHVKTRGPLMHSWNYAPDQIVFPEYVEVEGKPGYYLIPDDAGVLYPDSTLNYRGRLYILTDETSCSAATIFPSVLVRNRRAVTVGRETMSGYHYLTAMKYNEVRLPNSKIILHVPLVMEVFDEAVTPRTPAGRGLMPDYPVPATYEEYFTATEDFILNRALELIAQGQYLGQDWFAELDAGSDTRGGMRILYAAAAVILLAGAVLALFRRRR